MLLAERLINEDRSFALTLIFNSRLHDVSKFGDFEFNHLWAGDEKFEEALEKHRRHNKHHPEYWGLIQRMPDLYIAEMVCDCFARSQEFGTSVEDWFKNQATKKYNFKWNDEVGKKIQKYLAILTATKF